ncbi:DUF1553 domain-containing protein [Aquincola sp. S2]|uniref:DUF1553 domain-containing protein n=1 Tax=Pseudaquabacterium terrae TaxID=2732868 RepID=A0ABX2EPX0_9BURK|nr:DUF1549 and DUF1553 domain-containing protein [Aquabacterium terrae]NRF70585.1 DUF1553 domain-containing protein [Aquabacterium terrae]
MNRIATLSLAAVLAGVSLAGRTATDYEAPGAFKRGSERPWAYSPLKPIAAGARAALPAVKDAKWVKSPLDAFILAKLEGAGIRPSAEADRATFIRRATLDAWGLLPTPEEVKAFVADKSPKAHDKLIDRLLASPRYGERQARRWLDLTRYADSDGYNTDGTRPNIWRYRDYVVQAFNSDKPFDRFVKEQLAGDELWPESTEALIATGFLRNLPDEINARDLNLKKQEVANDLTDTVGSVFLGATINCAQCHDHKSEKLSQKEYYQFQAYFANASWKDDVTALSGDGLKSYLARYAAWEAATKPIREQRDALLKPVVDKLESDRLSGFVPKTRESITKPAAERDAYDRWIHHRNLWTMSGRTRNAENQLKTKDKEAWAKYEALGAELKKLDPLKPKDPGQISTMTELGADAPPTRVLFKGIYDRPLEEVQPGLPALWSEVQPDVKPTATSSGRRTALANWLVSPDNGLTTRTFVNRQWAQFFGRGIVETLADFGKTGTKPTHPELLDHLAGDFVKNGWSVKKLHRQILLSATYAQASAPRADDAAVAKADPDNKLLWAFPRQRLEAEQIRDSLLAASGLLVEKVGGPAVFPPIPPNFDIGGQRNRWVTSQDPRDHHRRSLYVFVLRNSPYPLLETFDWANPQSPHHRREVTTTAPQALALVNSDLVLEWSKALAGRVLREAPSSDAARIERVYQILYARKPTAAELAKLGSFLNGQEALQQAQAPQLKKPHLPEGYGVEPALSAQIERFYQAVYRRAPDRFEKAAFIGHLDQQKAQLGSSAGAGDDDGGAPAEASPTPPKGAPQKQAALSPARASAFVDLVHTLVNANEFTYRF